jgi:tRNA nucleotidyltransferase (CCA-adding enzyme)
VLRAFQFAARFELTLAPETAALCRSIVETYHELPVERVWGEWDKWATQAVRPSRGLAVLEETGWLVHFPEVAALRGCPQDPDWHPEGDVFTHTQHCCDALVGLPDWRDAPPARRRMLLLAVLAHDFGKPSTTCQSEHQGRLRWRSLGHESSGGPLADSFLRRIGALHSIIEAVRPLVVLHLAHHHGNGDFTDSHIRRLARKLHPATIDDLCAVMTADSLGRPPLTSPENLALIEKLHTRAHQLSLRQAPPRPLLLGRHLIALGEKPGPRFTELLAAAFEAQLDGAFTDEETGLIWLRNYLQDNPPPHS